jgi:hypothetical protein
MVHPVPKEEKYPVPVRTNLWQFLTRPGQKIRIVHDPNGNNEYHMKETTGQLPSGHHSVWNNPIEANKAVRQLEWEKIQASPDPERALQRYNEFNSQWITYPKYTLGLFRLEKENVEYAFDPDTSFVKKPRYYSAFPFLNYRGYPKKTLEPTYFGYSRKVQ